jgi:hypothetical protein
MKMVEQDLKDDGGDGEGDGEGDDESDKEELDNNDLGKKKAKVAEPEQVLDSPY